MYMKLGGWNYQSHLAYNVKRLGEEAENECSKGLQIFKLNTNVQ